MTKKTQISPLSAMALGATAMVGSGWLFSAQLNAQLAGNYAFLAWVTAASVAVIVAICLASVVKKYPVRGAVPYHIIKFLVCHLLLPIGL